MKNLFFLGIIALMMCGTTFTAQGQTWDISKTAADHVTATLSDGTLTISGTGAMRIWGSAGTYWGNFHTLIIGDSVTTIGDNAFTSGCFGLTSVTIGNSVTTIGNYAFEGCSGLTSLTIGNSVTTIGLMAFRGCRALTSVTIPNSVTSIGMEAFFECYQLETVIIPSSVIVIGEDAFWGTPWNDTLPDNEIIYINNVLYQYRGTIPNVTTINIRNGTISISPYAFLTCLGLTSLTIPSSVTSIGTCAFEGLILTSITCFNPDPSAITLGSDVFLYMNKNDCILYVPAGSVSAYQSAPQWKDFKNIVGNVTGIKNTEIQNLKIFPNPVKDELYITAKSLINKVEIYNVEGKMLMQENKFAEKMNVSSLAEGIYVVKVYTNGKVAKIKIIKN